MHTIDRALGGRGDWVETGHLWHMLAVGNVLTLGFLCLLIRSDVVRFLPALPVLVFLKMCSALLSLGVALAQDVPAFFAVFVLDASTSVLMAVLSLRAAWSVAADRSAPWWARWLLIDPEAVEASLALARQRGLAQANLWQMLLAARAMWHRIVFRSDTIGTNATGRARVRSTWRARLLANRAVRLPFLFWERAIMPLDSSGLAASPARTLHHLLAAHHDDGQALYDLELLALRDGALEELRVALARVVDGTHPRASWLRDLCVYEGYHEVLLRDVEAALAGALPSAASPDLSLAATLAWCAAQPASPAETPATFRPRFSHRLGA